MTLEMNAVSFRYPLRRRHVLEDFSAAVTEFPCVLLGPNGAGKSTLLALIASRYSPRSGRISLNGAAAATLRRLVGWLPQEARALAGFSVRQQVAYMGWLRGMRYGEAWSRAVGALEAVDLGREANSRATALSGGQRRRLALAGTLVASPALVVLDEPYAGLDPEQRSVVRELLITASSRSDLLVSTHQTEDLDRLYRTVVVMDDGEVAYLGSIEDFLALAPAGVPRELAAEAAYRAILTDWRASR